MKSLIALALLFVATAAHAEADLTCKWNNGAPIELKAGGREFGIIQSDSEALMLSVTEKGNLRVRQSRSGEVILHGKQLNVTYITKFQVVGNSYRLEFPTDDVLACQK